MAECPDKNCRDKVVRNTSYLRILGGAIGILITTFLVVGMYVMAADKKKVEDIGQNEQQIAIIQTELTHIRTEVKETKQEVEKIREQLKSDKKEIIDTIVRAIER